MNKHRPPQAEHGPAPSEGDPARPISGIDDEAAFEAFFSHWFPRLVSTLRRRGLDGSAEDVAQETLVRVFQRRDTIDFSRPTGPLLRTVALNLEKDLHKRERRQVPTEPEAFPDSAQDPPDIEVRLVVEQALAQLPERQQLAMRLHYQLGLGASGIGERLGINRIASSQLLSRSRKGFEVALRRVGGTA